MACGHRKILKFLKQKYKQHKAQKAQEAGQASTGAAGGGAWSSGAPPQQQQPASYYQQGQQQPSYYQQQPQGYAAQQQQPPSTTGGGWSAASDEGLGGNATDLRNQAIREGDLMSQCFDDAHKAYESGNGGRAKELSEQGHAHQKRMNELNDQASSLIFQRSEKNASQPQGTVDLHGLYVQEAIDKSEEAIRNAQSQGLSELRLIVGKGIHSKSHVAKIKPAIENLMHKYNLSAALDPHNAGVLVVNLSGQGSRDPGFVDEVARQASGRSDECIIA